MEKTDVPELTTVVAGQIVVTDAAAAKINGLLAEEQKKEAGLRVFVQGGGCFGFQYGLLIEDGGGDAEAHRIFQSNGVTLFVDPISIRYLKGAEVDFVDNLTGGGFTIKNPNAKSDVRVRPVVRSVASRTQWADLRPASKLRGRSAIRASVPPQS